MLGQVNASLPIFAGFKKNSIKAYDNMYQAEAASAMQTKEEVAMIVVNYYASLYAQKTVELLKENQKSAQQRVTDFSTGEKRNYSKK
jgi:outer membrane protein TolC